MIIEKRKECNFDGEVSCRIVSEHKKRNTLEGTKDNGWRKMTIIIERIF